MTKRTVIVLGATGGLGRAVTERFRDDGTRVLAFDARIPAAHLLKRSMPTPWAAKGSVMRTVVEAAGDRTVDTTDGVRIVEPDGGWVLVLPDPAEAVTHLWAEGADADAAQELLDRWAAIAEQAGA